MVVVPLATGKRRQGCYSVKYTVEGNFDSFYAMDYGWQDKNLWGCSETSVGRIMWMPVSFSADGYLALLNHFGLEQSDISMRDIMTKSPADLARLRRAKEHRYGLPYLEMKVQRLGCPKDEMADDFEAVL